MPMSAQSRRRLPRKPNTPLATPLTAAPHSASSAASGPRLPPGAGRAGDPVGVVRGAHGACAARRRRRSGPGLPTGQDRADRRPLWHGQQPEQRGRTCATATATSGPLQGCEAALACRGACSLSWATGCCYCYRRWKHTPASKHRVCKCHCGLTVHAPALCQSKSTRSSPGSKVRQRACGDAHRRADEHAGRLLDGDAAALVDGAHCLRQVPRRAHEQLCETTQEAQSRRRHHGVHTASLRPNSQRVREQPRR